MDSGGYVKVEGAARAMTDSCDRYIILLVVLSEQTHIHTETMYSRRQVCLAEGGLSLPIRSNDTLTERTAELWVVLLFIFFNFYFTHCRGAKQMPDKSMMYGPINSKQVTAQ